MWFENEIVTILVKNISKNVVAITFIIAGVYLVSYIKPEMGFILAFCCFIFAVILGIFTAIS